MAGIPERPDAFFRLSPAADSKAQCFAVPRGEISRRFDPANHRPEIRERLARLASHATVTLRSITKLCYRYPTFYGFDYQPSGVLVLKGENISRDGELVAVAEPSYISAEVHARFPRTHLEKDDLIISVRGEVGKVGIISENLAGSNINANTIRISLHEQAKEEELLPKFIWLFLNSDLGQLLIRQFIAGGVQETITAPELLEVRIPKLDLDIQKTIVDTMNAARTERRAKQAEANALLAGLGDYLLVTLGLTPPPKDERKVFAVSRGLLGSQARLNADYFHPERILALRTLEHKTLELDCPRLEQVVNFIRDQIKTPDHNYLSLANVQSNTGELVPTNEEVTGACSVFKRGDVLFARLRPYLNKVHVAESDGCCSPEFHVLRVKDNEAIRPDYLAAILRSSLTLAQTRHMMTGNTHPRLTNEDVVSLVIPAPKPAIQEAIAVEARRRREEARRLLTEADSGWHAAKRWFEEQLLGPVQP